ncbi:hypothetical protein [Allobaculum sp. Allo2]|uniref:hypothetical protein n=1 Tax=Allobaculum sp. Allo2 TaxID=2853432 RepID=UPI001F614EE8|nr:hypothetical protein [Allobaculum sp. Allo2]
MDYRYDHILIRYGELSLKGKNRQNFIQKLKDNLKKALKGFPTLELETQYDRMYLYLHDEDQKSVRHRLQSLWHFLVFSGD